MNTQSVNNSNNDTKINSQNTVKYPELNDSELEVVCGGGNLIGRRRTSHRPQVILRADWLVILNQGLDSTILLDQLNIFFIFFVYSNILG
ncbi:hypothetical protein [Anabaena sp. CCY 9402-a]|uniref:hypothetical protein n=1 Tax=Anabaena sp. CCY 9402-a TaxID=3103867 RepID=UPI0039C7452E